MLRMTIAIASSIQFWNGTRPSIKYSSMSQSAKESPRVSMICAQTLSRLSRGKTAPRPASRLRQGYAGATSSLGRRSFSEGGKCGAGFFQIMLEDGGSRNGRSKRERKKAGDGRDEKHNAARAEYNRLAASAWSPRPLKSPRSKIGLRESLFGSSSISGNVGGSDSGQAIRRFKTATVKRLTFQFADVRYVALPSSSGPPEHPRAGGLGTRPQRGGAVAFSFVGKWPGCCQNDLDNSPLCGCLHRA